MKKFFAMLMVLMMVCSAALACDCQPGAVVRMTAGQIVDMNVTLETSELEALASIAIGDEVDCQTAKSALLNAIFRNYHVMTMQVSEQRMEMLLAYLAHCCCDNCGMDDIPAVTVAPVVTPQPTRQPAPAPTSQPKGCNHRGGNHENRGQCVVCGEIYQDHSSPSGWVSENSTWHYGYCSYPGCDVRMTSGRHQWDGKTYARENGLKKVYCVICQAFSYIRDDSASTVPANDCCGCCNGKPCEGDSCGCGCNKH